jgi:acyl carrier protein
MKVLEKLQEVFDEVFMDVQSLTVDTTADDIEEWDSLTNVALIVTIEKKFGIEFATGEVESLKNVGDLCSSIESKIA